MNAEITKSLRHNVIVNLIDGGFFGMAIGFASFVTVIPLFVSSMTDSAILIGLIPAIHALGWQLPQLPMAERVSRLRRYKPMVLWLTIQERIPFLGFALVAWTLPLLGDKPALWITYFLLIWQSLGAGLTANPWQNLIAKIIPPDLRGTFLGAQASIGNALSSLGAVLAGFILEAFNSPLGYVYCFLLASLCMAISWIALALTHEPESAINISHERPVSLWTRATHILSKDMAFRWFILIRMAMSFATMAFAFYTVYAVRQHQMSESTIGIMTGVLMGTQIVANPVMGWLGDRWGHSRIMKAGAFACIMSALLAAVASHPGWFYLIFMLTGIGNVILWITPMAIMMNFSNEADRPAYIGLANTLVAPSTILAPFLGGWLADHSGYRTTFLMSVAFGVFTLITMQAKLRFPQKASNLVD